MQSSPHTCSCPECSEFLDPTLKASKVYHELLADLEAAHIRKDVARAIHIRDRLNEALRDRDAKLAGVSLPSKHVFKTPNGLVGKLGIALHINREHF